MDVVENVTTIAELKVLDPAQVTLTLLPEATGFDWKAGDATSDAAFDPQEHVIVASDVTTAPLTAGAWYRRLKGDRPGVRDAFKARGDNSTDDTAAIQDAIDWMEFYPQRSRVLTFEPGLYKVQQLTIDAGIPGLQFVGNHWDSNIVCTDDSSAPVFLNKSQEFKMDGMTIMSTIENATNWANRKNAVSNLKDYGPTVKADVDCIFHRCRFAGFYRGVYHKGRSVVIRNSHFSGCDYALELDWPSNGDYLPESNQLTDDLGFRGVVFENCRIHSPRGGAVINARENAHKLRGFKMSGIIMDIGRRLFYGHLGRGARLSDMISDMTPVEVLALTGGEDFEITGITGKGSSKAGAYSPENLVLFLEGGVDPDEFEENSSYYSDPYNRETNSDGTTGRFRNGRISNSLFAYCEKHAIRDVSSEMEHVFLGDITFRDVGFSAPSSYRCISLGSQNSDIAVINPDFMGADTLNAVVGNNYNTNKVKVSGPKRSIGNVTPWTGGSPIVLIGKRQSYTPTPVAVTNVSSVSSSSLDWVMEDDDLVRVNGRIVAQATAIGECVIDIPLPWPSTFTQPYHASGSMISGQTGTNMAGAVVASGSMMRVRWSASSTLNTSFSFSATYRVL